MGPKRKLEDHDGQEPVHASRRLQVYGHNQKAAKKPRQKPSKPLDQLHPSSVYRHQAASVNAIKKRIRDVTRKLEHSENLPANIRMEDERALAAYQQELTAAEAEKARQKMISRYHMVRFFERQKATRNLKKLRKRLLETESTDEVEALKKEMHVAEIDLNYTQYCPLNEPYVSLYPQKSSDGEDDVVAEPPPKPAMWAEVEKCMEEGTLDRLRNRSSAVKAPPAPRPLEIRPKAKPKSQPATIDTTAMNRRERRSQRAQDVFAGRTRNKSMAFERNQAFGATQAAQNENDEDDDSDGGFFEESGGVSVN